MKKVKLWLSLAKEDISNALTPELKHAACEDAKTFIAEHFTGITETFATFLINELEETIKEATTA